MQPVCRVGDTGSGHDVYPPTNATAGSPSVKVNGIPVFRVGDPLAAHEHGRAGAGGSGTVKADGIPVMRQGDPVDCGGSMVNGSGNVFAG